LVLRVEQENISTAVHVELLETELAGQSSRFRYQADLLTAWLGQRKERKRHKGEEVFLESLSFFRRLGWTDQQYFGLVH